MLTIEQRYFTPAFLQGLPMMQSKTGCGVDGARAEAVAREVLPKLCTDSRLI